MSTYFDTSVVAACYIREPLSEPANRALSEADARVLSSLTETEMHSVVALRQRVRTLRGKDARAVLRAFHRHIEGQLYSVVPVEPGDFRLASRYLDSSRSGLRTLDALHLAIGQRVGDLVTADRVLAEAAGEMGIACRLLEKS